MILLGWQGYNNFTSESWWVTPVGVWLSNSPPSIWWMVSPSKVPKETPEADW